MAVKRCVIYSSCGCAQFTFQGYRHDGALVGIEATHIHWKTYETGKGVWMWWSLSVWHNSWAWTGKASYKA
ncbi:MULTISPECIES: hypothetical protein [Enterobacterales]|uniref:hypothetical protein n=1 Tax=Enterobacterales TaxID=91347 RepID=UPI002ED8E9A2